MKVYVIIIFHKIFLFLSKIIQSFIAMQIKLLLHLEIDVLMILMIQALAIFV